MRSDCIPVLIAAAEGEKFGGKLTDPSDRGPGSDDPARTSPVVSGAHEQQPAINHVTD